MIGCLYRGDFLMISIAVNMYRLLWYFSGHRFLGSICNWFVMVMGFRISYIVAVNM